MNRILGAMLLVLGGISPLVVRAEAPLTSSFPLLRGEIVLAMGKPSRNAICGNPALSGEVRPKVIGKIAACGIEEPIRLSAVYGVPLSNAALVDCTTANAFATWVKEGVIPEFKRKGGGLSKIDVVASYSCRTRNHKKGAKISEHGKGRAIDVAGFSLKDGTEVTVLRDWRSKAFGAAMKNVHKAACGPFGTVLGPAADKYHLDHFHFDTARYRSGSYCR